MTQIDYSSTRDPTLFRRRVTQALCLIFACFLLLFLRLVYLQLLHQSDFLAAAEANRTVLLPIAPQRGLVRDRNGLMLAQNYWAYSLEVTPSKLGNKPLDTVLDELATVVSITSNDRRRFKRQREEARRFEPIAIRIRLTDEEMARFVAQRWRFPGVNIQPRLYRDYPQRSCASHLIGYIGRISRKDIRSIEEAGKAESYQGIRSMGKVGIERSYEDVLRGEPGHEMIEVTAGGRLVRNMGITPPRPGKNVELSLDSNLQRIAETAFGQEMGAAIAIEPKTGEVLAFVSAPAYDPNNFPDGIDPDTWEELSQSESKPLLNRAARGLYPIGSTYKPFMALAGLEYGVITPETAIHDTGIFEMYEHQFRDSTRSDKGMVNLRRSIVISSDVYYYWLANELGVQRITPFMKQWGFGQLTGIDLVGEQRGTLPTPEWKEKRFKQPWMPGDTVNLGIGQGYNQFTLLQLAHATATLANRGVVMTPHIVRRIIDPTTDEVTWPNSKPVQTIPLLPENIRTVVDAMVGVTREGTGRIAFDGVPYSVAGKTGTAQIVSIAQGEKYDAKHIARELHDHALFIAFAPADEPKIAVAILKENGGFGAKAAAPIARAMLDYWILGKNSLGLPPPGHLSGVAIPAIDFPIPQPVQPPYKDKRGKR